MQLLSRPLAESLAVSSPRFRRLGPPSSSVRFGLRLFSASFSDHDHLSHSRRHRSRPPAPSPLLASPALPRPPPKPRAKWCPDASTRTRNLTLCCCCCCRPSRVGGVVDARVYLEEDIIAST